MGKEPNMLYVIIGVLAFVAIVMLIFATSAGRLNKRDEEQEQGKK